MTDRFQVGVIASTHGLQGEVNVFPTTEDPNRFKKLKKVTLHTQRGEELELEVQSARFFKKFVIVKFKEFNNINEVEKFRGCELTIDRKDALKLEPGEYYCADLIGLDIIDEDGNVLGKVSDIIQTGANDVYAVSRESGKELLIPAIRECILDVDLKEGRMKVHLLPGLADL